MSGDLMAQPSSAPAVQLNNQLQNMQRNMAAPDSLLQTQTGEPEYAARYFNRTKAEEDIDLKQKFVQGVAKKINVGQGPNEHVQVAYAPTDRELDIVKRKQAEQVQFAFHTFVKSLVKPGESFVNAKYFAEQFPDILQKELDEVDVKFDMLRRLAKIMIRNQINQEDAAFLYSIATLPPGQKEEFIAWLKYPVFLPWDKMTASKIRERGRLNPKRMLGAGFDAYPKGTLNGFAGTGASAVPTIFDQGFKQAGFFAGGLDHYDQPNTTNMLANFFGHQP
jgi:hypothetical protein